MPLTNIPEIDAFIETEIELIGGESNEKEKEQLFHILHAGIRTILTAQLQLPAEDDDTADERVKRRIETIKGYMEKVNGVDE